MKLKVNEVGFFVEALGTIDGVEYFIDYKTETGYRLIANYGDNEYEFIADGNTQRLYEIFENEISAELRP